jgi:hypothetical protein
MCNLINYTFQKVINKFIVVIGVVIVKLVGVELLYRLLVSLEKLLYVGKVMFHVTSKTF